MLTYNLQLKRKKTIKMPIGVYMAQAVVVGGKVYIKTGGGWLKYYTMLEYTIEGGQWNWKMETPVQSFGMAVVNDQLIITGGAEIRGSPTNQVWVLDSITNTWTQPFPAMPTARIWSSAVGYKRWVLVVGGDGEKCVEVLDTMSKQWFVASPLPSAAVRPSLAVVQDTLYVVWSRLKSAVSVSIPMLISDAMSRSQASVSTNEPRPTEWQLLPYTPTADPAITSFRSYLLAVGAWGSSTIAIYLPHTEQWLTVAELPTRRWGCTCVVLPETEELMVIGGQDVNTSHIETIDIYQS